MEHIDNMDELKNGIGLRAYGQKDPVVQYRIEGFDMFDEMVNNIKIDITKSMLHLEKADNVQREEAAEITDASLRDTAISLVDGSITPQEGGVNKTVVNEVPKVGRNDLCPCGSGKKYKNCCGRNQ
jgi:preprotein translocase subunit SecA